MKSDLKKIQEIKRVRKLKRYSSTDNLPAELFFKISYQRDNRFLLITDNYPDFIPEDLKDIWEVIKKEYEKHSGDNSYTSKLADLDEEIREINDLNRIKAIYSLMRLGDERMIEELEEVGIYIDKIGAEAMQEVLSTIKIMQTNIEIGQIVKKSMESIEKGEEFNFLQSLNQMSNLFGRTIPRDIVTTEWIYLTKDVQKMKKPAKNGRATAI